MLYILYTSRATCNQYCGSPLWVDDSIMVNSLSSRLLIQFFLFLILYLVFVVCECTVGMPLKLVQNNHNNTAFLSRPLTSCSLSPATCMCEYGFSTNLSFNSLRALSSRAMLRVKTRIVIIFASSHRLPNFL